MILQLLSGKLEPNRFIDSRNSALKINENITNDKELLEIVDIIDKEIENLILTNNIEGFDKVQDFVEKKIDLLKERKDLILKLKQSQASEKGKHDAVSIDGEWQNNRNLYFFKSLLIKTKKAHEFVLVKKLYKRGEINELYAGLLDKLITNVSCENWDWLNFDIYDGVSIYISNEFGDGYKVYFKAKTNGVSLFDFSDIIFIDENELNSGEDGKIVIWSKVELSQDILKELSMNNGFNLNAFEGIDGLYDIRYYRVVDGDVDFDSIGKNIEGGSNMNYVQKGDFIRIELEKSQDDITSILQAVNERFEEYFND